MQTRELFSAGEIQEIVACIAARIKSNNPDASFTLLVVLKGAVPFSVDLARHLGDQVARTEYVTASSYCGGTDSGELKVGKLPNLFDQHVIIVDDILDTGKTANALIRAAYAAGARAVDFASAFVKIVRTVTQRDELGKWRTNFYSGFSVHEFVIGYGLDYKEKYRNLPNLLAVEL